MSPAAEIGVSDLPLPAQVALPAPGVLEPDGRVPLPAGLRPELRPRTAPLPQAFVRLHHAVDALRATPRSPMALQLMAAHPGAGTSTVASGLAAAIAVSQPGGVLVVACDNRTGQAGDVGSTLRETCLPSLSQLLHAGRDLGLACRPDPDRPGVLRAALGAGANPLVELSGPELRGLLVALGERFPTVLLDCPSGQDAPDAASLSRHCDGTLLVVRAERSRVDVVASLRREIERAGGHVVGVVLNRQRRHLPPWLDRLL